MQNNEKILVGKIVAPQGLRGEMRVQTYTQNPTDFKTLMTQPNVKFVRAVPSSDVIIVRMDGIDNRNLAETMRGVEIFITRDSLPKLNDDEIYYADLIGMKMGDQTVVDVHNFGAGDILELSDGGMISINMVDINKEDREIKELV